MHFSSLHFFHVFIDQLSHSFSGRIIKLSVKIIVQSILVNVGSPCNISAAAELASELLYCLLCKGYVLMEVSLSRGFCLIEIIYRDGRLLKIIFFSNIKSLTKFSHDACDPVIVQIQTSSQY